MTTETEEEKAAREAQEAKAAEAKAAEEVAREAELAALTPEERAAKEAEDAAAAEAAAAAAKGEKKEGGAEEEVTVQIGDEKPPAEEKAPGWVREVRERNRELAKRNRELEAQLAGQKKADGPGKEPTLEDYDYDADKFKAGYAAWFEKKRKADEQAAQLLDAQKAEQTAWQGKLDAYGKAKTEIKVPDLDEAESLVQETLSQQQQAIIVKGARNPALLVYALGKNPAKLKELAAITDLVEFAAAVFRDVEGQLKVTKKPAPPAPERKVEGTGQKSGAVDSQLDRLRAEAERTGDYTKVVAYKNQKKAA